jgi:DNA-binding MarR family transcriptional regulator
MKGMRKPSSGFELADAPSHLIKRCLQFYGDLYLTETGGGELTKQQYTVLAALENNDGVSQTALVEMTGIDRSTLAEMIHRMLERGLITRERTETDARANAIAVTAAGRRALRTARQAAERAEKAFLEPLAASERSRFVKALAAIAAAGEAFASGATEPPRAKPKRRRS